MAQLGVVIRKTGHYVAKIDTLAAGTRYKMLGPPRGDDEQVAYQDLCYIRAAAEGAPSPYRRRAFPGAVTRLV